MRSPVSLSTPWWLSWPPDPWPAASFRQPSGTVTQHIQRGACLCCLSQTALSRGFWSHQPHLGLPQESQPKAHDQLLLLAPTPTICTVCFMLSHSLALAPALPSAWNLTLDLLTPSCLSCLSRQWRVEAGRSRVLMGMLVLTAGLLPPCFTALKVQLVRLLVFGNTSQSDQLVSQKPGSPYWFNKCILSTYLFCA